MTFREFMKKYKKKRKRIDVVGDEDFWYYAAMLSEKYLKKAYNAGYEEGFEKGLDKGLDECESVHKVIDKVKVIEVRNEN